MSSKLEIFRTEYLNNYSHGVRRDGGPSFDIFKRLSSADLQIAESELLAKANLVDLWPVMALGFLKSEKALPKLYKLLSKSKSKIEIAYVIFQINEDPEMIEVVSSKMNSLSEPLEIGQYLYFLPKFKSDVLDDIVRKLRNHPNHLVSDNAKSVMKYYKIKVRK